MADGVRLLITSVLLLNSSSAFIFSSKLRPVNMADGGQGCWHCCSFIFILGLAALVMWLSLRADKPKCSIQDFYLPALNKTLNDTANSTLYITLRLDNPNKDKGIYYDHLNVTVSDTAPNGSHLVGNTTIDKFYQGHKKKAKKHGEVATNKTVVSQAVFPNRTALFRVYLETAVRYKIMFWKTKRYKIKVRGDVEVNDNGTKVDAKKNVKLKSSAPKVAGSSVLEGFLLNFLVLTWLRFW